MNFIPRKSVALAALGALALGACGGSSSSTTDTVSTADTVSLATPADLTGTSVIVYSGRSEELVGDLFTAFTDET